jgi:hypothetical protein
VTVVQLVSDLLTVLAQDSRAFEEKVPIAATAIARFFLRLLLALGQSVNRTTRRIRGGALTLVSLFVS